MRSVTIDVAEDGSLRANGQEFSKLLSSIANVTLDPPTLRHDTPREVAVACVAHHANCLYCSLIGDTVPPAWDDLPGEMQAGMIDAVRLVERGEIITPQEAHTRWMAARIDAGWVYGPEKSQLKKTHPNLVEYDRLPASQRTKDRLFLAVAGALLAAE